MHPSHNKQWFKTVHEYFKDFDEQHRLHTTRRSLRLSSGIRIALGKIQREKYCFYPPLSPHVDFVFQQSSTRHVSLDYKAMLQTVNGLLRHFKTQWILYETRKLPRTLIRKSPYTKAGHF
ncbi:hypothetical protein TNCT_267031 [Trichonephila clavata]|uniref:Uncharacterized protein n=1 Tax=Trichonephila clavata TaxID=2740835 RepID=A0A8X6LA18_TRICU|nr:hypothetical protein TNCT_267031 [Trichonephila clavata]